MRYEFIEIQFVKTRDLFKYLIRCQFCLERKLHTNPVQPCAMYLLCTWLMLAFQVYSAPFVYELKCIMCSEQPRSFIRLFIDNVIRHMFLHILSFKFIEFNLLHINLTTITSALLDCSCRTDYLVIMRMCLNAVHIFRLQRMEKELTNMMLILKDINIKLNYWERAHDLVTFVGRQHNSNRVKSA